MKASNNASAALGMHRNQKLTHRLIPFRYIINVDVFFSVICNRVRHPVHSSD